MRGDSSSSLNIRSAGFSEGDCCDLTDGYIRRPRSIVLKIEIVGLNLEELTSPIMESSGSTADGEGHRV